jgi:Mrp family chromosome partitioning ATPase
LPEPQRPFVRARTEVLTREAAAASRSLDKLSATTVTPGRLLAAAKPPRRATAPAPLVWAASGLGVGLIAAVGATLLRDRTERRLRRREDVERVFGLPVLGALPAAFSVDKASLSRCGTGPFRYAAAELAAAVRPGGQLVLVAGASHAVPSGEAAVHLAGALARSGYDTLVVLADERDRDLGRQLGAGPVGLSDVVLDAIDPSTLTRDVAGLPDVRVIGPGAAPAEAGERLADPVEPALRRLRGLAHYVLIAGGAVVDTAQTGALANRVDATVLTVQLRRTNRNDVRESLRRLSGDPVVGAILVPAGRQHGRSPVLAGGAAPAGR